MPNLLNIFWPKPREGDFLGSARERAFVCFCLIGGLTTFVSGVSFAIAESANYPFFVTVTTIGPLAYFIFPVLITRGMRFARIRDFAAAYTYLLIGLTLVLAGGPLSRATFFLISITFLGSYLYPWRKAVGFSLVSIALLVAAHYWGGHRSTDLSETFPTLSYQEASTWLVFSFAWMLCLSVSATIAFLAEMDKAANQLRNAQIAADDANKAKSEFLANMSHEIRTPMNGVLGMAELLKQTELTRQQSTFADTIYASGNALLTIINDILDFSKIEAGQLELDPAPFCIHEIVEDVAALLGVSARQKGIEIIVRTAPNLPERVVGDGPRLRQAVMNLAGNAVKFTKEGHVVIDVWGMPNGDMAQLNIDVVDTGIGIAPDKIGMIFEQFTQAENSTTREYGGTGLGLSITRSLIDAMGGKVSAKSTLGKGSTFSINLALPVCQQAVAPAASIDHLSGARAAIIDDNPVNRAVLEEQLFRWGAKTELFEDGPSALDGLRAAAANSDPFSLVIVDFQMPLMSGLEFVDALRKDEKISQAPVIVLSSVDDGAVLRDFRALGVSDALTKPVRKSHLERAIASALADDSAARLRATAAEATRNAEHPPQEKNQLTHLLIAEDNEVNRMVISHMVDKTRYRIDFAENGAIACEKAITTRYDLILMDVAMPEMDGVEATKQIRAFEHKKGCGQTPIIALTAHAMAGDRDRFLDAGMDDYISKPVKKDVLDKVLSKWRARAAMPASSDAPAAHTVSRP